VRKPMQQAGANERPTTEVSQYEKKPGGSPNPETAPYLDPHGSICVLGCLIGFEVPVEGLFEKTGYIVFFIVSAMSGVIDLHFR
jgi:hypothetical protein